MKQLIFCILILLGAQNTFAENNFESRQRDVISQSIIDALNKNLDQNYIRVDDFWIENSKINLLLQLKDENEKTRITIEEFDWKISKDYKNIVLFNIKLSSSIAWLEYALTKTLSLSGQEIKIKNTFFSGLFFSGIKNQNSQSAQ